MERLVEKSWSDLLADILRGAGISTLPSNHITVGSDYCGDDGTVWWTAAFLVIDWDATPSPRTVFNALIERSTSVPQWKSFRSNSDLRIASDFLERANTLNGCLITFTSRAKMFDVSLAKNSNLELSERKVLRHDWSNRKRFERATRVCHVLARILQVATDKHAEVEWFTDGDEICDCKAATLDLVSIATSLRRHYCGATAPAIRVASSLKENHAETARALTVIPDLVAGAVNEKIRAQFDFSNRQEYGETHTVVLTPPSKADRFLCIEGWLASDVPGIKKVQIVLDGDGDKIRLHRIISHPFEACP